MSELCSSLPTFILLRLTTRAVAIGERVKKGTFRPCVETLPSSTLIGCLREHFGLEETVAIGFFQKEAYRKETFTYAPFDAHLRTSKLPLTLEYLVPTVGRREIQGEVYVANTSEAKAVFTPVGGPWYITLGAMRSKGFGQCLLEYVKEVTPSRRTGYLRGHFRETDASAFGIKVPQDIIRPRYGFLFRPDSYLIGGRYERALFAGSILTGPDFLIGEDYAYDP